MSEERDELTVLRDIWAARGQSGADIGADLGTGGGKVCKNMKNIGFGGISGEPVDGSTATPVDDEQRAAWRARLAREGKIAPGSTTIGAMIDAGTAADAPGAGPTHPTP